MNLVECYITEIVGKPTFLNGLWYQKVKYISYGTTGETELFCKNPEDFKVLCVNFKFYA